MRVRRAVVGGMTRLDWRALGPALHLWLRARKVAANVDKTVSRRYNTRLSLEATLSCLKIELEIAECARRTRGSETGQGFGESLDLIILSDSDALSSNSATAVRRAIEH